MNDWSAVTHGWEGRFTHSIQIVGWHKNIQTLNLAASRCDPPGCIPQGFYLSLSVRAAAVPTAIWAGHVASMRT
jgi:hypothetical protein